MRFVLASIALALALTPGSVFANEQGPADAPANLEIPEAPVDDGAWIMVKKMRRMSRRDLEPADAVPEPSAALVFGVGALIVSERLRRRRNA